MSTQTAVKEFQNVTHTIKDGSKKLFKALKDGLFRFLGSGATFRPLADLPENEGLAGTGTATGELIERENNDKATGEYQDSTFYLPCKVEFAFSRNDVRKGRVNVSLGAIYDEKQAFTREPSEAELETIISMAEKGETINLYGENRGEFNGRKYCPVFVAL